MPKAVSADALIRRKRGRPEGPVSLEVRAALSMLREGTEAVSLDIPEGVSRERVASKASRIAPEYGLKVSVYDTADGDIAIALRSGTTPDATADYAPDEPADEPADEDEDS